MALMVWGLRQHAIDREVSAAATLMLQWSPLRIEFVKIVELGRIMPGAYRDLIVVVRHVGESADADTVVLRRRIIRLRPSAPGRLRHQQQTIALMKRRNRAARTIERHAIEDRRADHKIISGPIGNAGAQRSEREIEGPSTPERPNSLPVPKA